MPDHLGWHEQGDGKLYLGLPIASGRIVDDGSARLRTALREIVAAFRLRPDPDAEPGHHPLRDRARPTATRSRRCCATTACASAEEWLPVERWALACPALPTCGLALTEAERVRDDDRRRDRSAVARLGARAASGSASASPAAPMAAPGPIAAISASSGACPGFYSLYVGGDFEGTRLNVAFADSVR